MFLFTQKITCFLFSESHCVKYLKLNMKEKQCSNSRDESQGIPSGKYSLVGWGVDTTGRRLIDEIFHIAAYTSNSDFSQYVMPLGGLTISCRRKHTLRIFNAGRHRILMDIRGRKFIKTKSSISALRDFLVWLEKIRVDANSDGIILMYHEVRKISPWMLLEELRRYNLVERFQKVVKGFANGFDIAQAKCKSPTNTCSLRLMSKLLLNREDEDFSSAVDRARVSYEIAAHFAQGESQDLDETKSSTGMESEIVEFVCPFVNTIPTEEEEVAEFKVLLERQKSFRSVFGAFLHSNRLERQRASHLRRVLAENNIIYEEIKEAFDNDGRQGLNRFLRSEIRDAKETELQELVKILDCFFDPHKEPEQRKPRSYQRTRRRIFFSKDEDSESASSPTLLSDNETGEFDED